MNDDYDPTIYKYPPSHIQIETAMAVAMNRCKSYGFNHPSCIAANKKANELTKDYVNYNTVTNMPEGSYDEKTEIPVMVEYYSDQANPIQNLRYELGKKLDNVKHKYMIRLILLIVLIVIIMLVIYHLFFR